MRDNTRPTADVITNSEAAGVAPVEEIRRWPAERRDQLIQTLIASPIGRRWLRSQLLGALPEPEREALAARLLAWGDDFDPFRRDPSTAVVVLALPSNTLDQTLCWLAGTNAASALWERLSSQGPERLFCAAHRVLREGSPLARETVLHLLFIDPGFATLLSEDERVDLLDVALTDPDAVVRGLAAEIACATTPTLLRRERDTLLYDEDDRVRSAVWTSLWSVDPEAAADQAIALLTDERAPLPVRRSALAALGQFLSTEQIAPILAWLVRHPEPELAHEAADLLWRHHRHPLVAHAAAASAHPQVRAVAERLLHPERGSPAAGGDRPGAAAPPSSPFEPPRKRPARRQQEL